MTPRIARRTAGVAVSVTVAVAGLLAVGGTASATALPSDEQSGLVRISDSHDRDRCSGVAGDDARRTWVLDQISWVRDHSLPHRDH
ncbi:hypothetical protein [Streptomyces sp. NPDC046805]|uniref:hypothetical protein n=1 Tax=Streptomyces sp. NPDC046805 TaxID=3155134 RepID=UPI0033ECD96F